MLQFVAAPAVSSPLGTTTNSRPVLSEEAYQMLLAASLTLKPGAAEDIMERCVSVCLPVSACLPVCLSVCLSVCALPTLVYVQREISNTHMNGCECNCNYDCDSDCCNCPYACPNDSDCDYVCPSD